MSLYLVTGKSGSGKSTLTLALRARGYTAYDTDDDSLARWQHNTTGYIHPKSSVKPEQRTPEFLANHSWNVPREVIEDLDKPGVPAFILGAMSNESAVLDLFTKVFALHIDEQTMTKRLTERTNNNWGKQQHELEQSVQTNQGAYERYQRAGYVILDATLDVDELVHIVTQDVAPVNSTDVV